MERYKCIVVDDERSAREALALLIKKIKKLELVATCKNAEEALHIIDNCDIRIVFLDIKMRRMNGFDFLRNLKKELVVIPVTGAPEYILKKMEGLNIYSNTTPFLLKTRLFKDFSKITDRAIKMNGFVSIMVDGKAVKIYPKDVLLIGAFGNYIKVLVKNSAAENNDGFYRIYITRKPLKEMQKALNAIYSIFVQVHKSYIVNSELCFMQRNKLRPKDHKKIDWSSLYPEASLESGVPIGRRFNKIAEEKFSSI